MGMPETDMFGKPWPGSNPMQQSLQQNLGASPFEGFDFARPQNVQKSAKDAFADLAKKAGPAPLNDKAALGQWFSQKIQPGMDALGHKVSSVDGDKFRYANHEGTYDVDYGRGAGADGGALAWQATDANAPLIKEANRDVSNTMPIAGQQSDLMAQILASLQGQQSVDPQMLLQQALAR